MDGSAVGGSGGDAETGHYAQQDAVLHAEARLHQSAQYRRGLERGDSGGGVGHEDDELVAAIAKTEVLGTA